MGWSKISTVSARGMTVEQISEDMGMSPMITLSRLFCAIRHSKSLVGTVGVAVSDSTKKVIHFLLTSPLHWWQMMLLCLKNTDGIR